MRKKKGEGIFKTFDPHFLTKSDKSTLMSFLDLALGETMKTFIHAGGHFADMVVAFRHGRNVVKVFPPSECIRGDPQETVGHDDLATLIHTEKLEDDT